MQLESGYAVSYSRFSSDNQDIKSIKDQEEENTLFAKNNNIQVLEYFRDEAKSGKNTDREGFYNMIHYCKEQNKKEQMIKYVIVWKFDRFSRNTYDATVYKNELRKSKVRVVSATQMIEDSAEGRFMESIIQANDQYYSENLSNNTIRGIRGNAKQGLWNGGRPPLGYKIVDKKYVINEEEAQLIKNIFNMFINEDKSTGDIAVHLNNNGFKTRTGKNFKANSIYDILRNEKYIGIFRLEFKNKNEVIELEDIIPAIVDRKDFDMVKEISQYNNSHRGKYSARHIYLLSGLIKCKNKTTDGSICNHNYIGSSASKLDKEGNKKYYRKYVCNNRNKYGDCTGISISAEAIEMLVINTLKEKLTNKDNVKEILKEIDLANNEYKNSYKEQYSYLSKQLQKIENRSSKIIDIMVDNFATEKLKKELLDLEEQEKNIKAELETFKERIDQENIKPLTSQNIYEMFLKDLNNFEHLEINDQKQILKKYIYEIEVHEKTIDIIFNIRCLNRFSSFAI